jgi:hypothetical protein
VYQLLDECAKAMAVRWPEGQGLLRTLGDKFRATAPDADLQMFSATAELFFPRKYDAAAREDVDDDRDESDTPAA